MLRSPAALAFAQGALVALAAVALAPPGAEHAWEAARVAPLQARSAAAAAALLAHGASRAYPSLARAARARSTRGGAYLVLWIAQAVDAVRLVALVASAILIEDGTNACRVCVQSCVEHTLALTGDLLRYALRTPRRCLGCVHMAGCARIHLPSCSSSVRPWPWRRRSCRGRTARPGVRCCRRAGRRAVAGRRRCAQTRSSRPRGWRRRQRACARPTGLALSTCCAARAARARARAQAQQYTQRTRGQRGRAHTTCAIGCT